MSKIKNTTTYPIKEYPLVTDYFIGSDAENNGETINFEIQTIINMASGLMDYKYSLSSLPLTSPEGDGYFLSNGITNFALITKISVSKKTLAGQDLTPFMNWLKTNLTEFTLYIVSKTNQNIFADFSITNVTEHTNYFEYTVELAPGNNYLGQLIHKDNYTFNYEKTASGNALDLLTQTITDGDTLHAPSADAVFDALALKSDDNNVIHKTGDETKTGNLTVNNIIRAGGSSIQYLMADGSISTLATIASGIIAPTIVDGDTTHAPSGDAVFDALALKANDIDVLHKTGNETKTGNLTVNSIIRAGGTISQFLMADGSVSTISNFIAPTIVDGDTTHAPDGNSVFDALALKVSNIVAGTNISINSFDPQNPIISAIPATSAGIFDRVYFTGQVASVATPVAPNYDTIRNGKGSVASITLISPAIAASSKVFFTSDMIGPAQTIAGSLPTGNFSSFLSVLPSATASLKRFTIEVFLCDNAGVIIPQAGPPSTDPSAFYAGKNTVVILDSGNLTLPASNTSVGLSGFLTTPLNVAVGQRFRYHISVARGAGGGAQTMNINIGNTWNSYTEAPVPLTTSTVINTSLVPGATATDALNALNTGKQSLFIATNILPKGSATGLVNSSITDTGTLVTIANPLNLASIPTTSTGTYDLLTRNTSTGVVEKVSSSVIGTLQTAYINSGSSPQITLSNAYGSFAIRNNVGLSLRSQEWLDETGVVRAWVSSSGGASFDNVVRMAYVQVTNGSIDMLNNWNSRTGSAASVLRSNGNVGVISSNFNYSADFSTSSLLTTNRTFTFPDKNGTFAMTSDIPANPITGTGTGANGQVAFFTGFNSQAGDAGFTWNNTSKLLTVKSIAIDNANGTIYNSLPTQNLHIGGANYITFDTYNGVAWIEQVRVANNGNVVVGTTDTSLGKFTINALAGTTALTLGDIATPASEVSMYFRSTTKSNINWSTGGRLAFNGGAGGSEKATILDNGNTGFGHPNPAVKVQISKTVSSIIGDSSTYLGLGGNENAPNALRLIGFGYKNLTNFYPAYIGYEETLNSGETYGDLIFLTRGVETNTAPSTRFRITAGGNVGVGVTPNRTLHIKGSYSEPLLISSTNGTTNLSGILFEAANTTYTPFIGANTNDFVVQTNGLERIRVTQGGTLDVKYGIITMSNAKTWDISSNANGWAVNETGIANTFYIKTGGNVGIGTTTLGAKLTLEDNNSAQSVLRLNKSVAGFSATMVYGTTVDTTGGYDFIGMYAGGVRKFNVNAFGDVAAAGTITAASDARLKTNIKPLKNSLSKLLKVNGFSFDRTDTKEKNQIGFIAQELEKIFPELVVTDSTKEKMKSVNYQAMVAVLVEAIKEQNERIIKLETLLNLN